MNTRDVSHIGTVQQQGAATARSIPQESWFVAQLKPNSDTIAQRNLLRQGITAFLPRFQKTERNDRRFRETRRPLFPGYIFVSVNLAEGRWRAINNTQGITRIVSFNARPAPLPKGFVEALQERCDEGGLVRPVEALAPGEMARITDGPFSDFIVRVESIGNDQRLLVLFDLMGRQTRLAVPRDALVRA